MTRASHQYGAPRYVRERGSARLDGELGGEGGEGEHRVAVAGGALGGVAEEGQRVVGRPRIVDLALVEGGAQLLGLLVALVDLYRGR